MWLACLVAGCQAGPDRPPPAEPFFEPRFPDGGLTNNSGSDGTSPAAGPVAPSGAQGSDAIAPVISPLDLAAFSDGKFDRDQVYIVGAIEGDMERRVVCKATHTNEIAAGFPPGVSQAYIDSDGRLIYYDEEGKDWWRWVPDDLPDMDSYPDDPQSNDEPVTAPTPLADQGDCGGAWAPLTYAEGGATLCDGGAYDPDFTWYDNEHYVLAAGDAETREPQTYFGFSRARPQPGGEGFWTVESNILYDITPDGVVTVNHRYGPYPTLFDSAGNGGVSRKKDLFLYLFELDRGQSYRGLVGLSGETDSVYVMSQSPVAFSGTERNSKTLQACHAYSGFVVTDQPP